MLRRVGETVARVCVRERVMSVEMLRFQESPLMPWIEGEVNETLASRLLVMACGRLR